MLLPGFFRYARRVGYRPKWFAGILALNLCAVLFEGIGIGSVLPVLEFIKAGGDVAQKTTDSELWRVLAAVADFLGLPLTLPTLLASSLLAICCRQVFLYARDLYTSWIQFELVRRVRNKGFHHFLHAGLGYHDRVRAGDFVNELTTELLTGISSLTSAANLTGTLILIVGYVTIVFALSPSLTLMAVGVLTVVSLLLVRLMSRIRQLSREVTATNQQTSTFLVERLKSVRLVKLSSVEDAEELELQHNTQAQADKLYERRKVIALLSVLIEPIVLAIAFILLYLAFTQLTLAFETIILFFFILVRLVPIVKDAILQRQGYLANLGSLEAIDARLSGLAIARDSQGGKSQLNRLQRGIEFQGIFFKYDAREDGESPEAALNGVSLLIPAGKMTAIVGPSGAGKSTLVDLMPRLRVPDEGQILFDNIAQYEFDRVSLRQGISFVPQTPQIFNVSVATHIRYGWPEAGMEDIVAAAKISQAHSFIGELPRGYDTLLGEGGSRLSGGQRQRLDLARALVRGAPVLVLDEPTSNLDAESEALFREALGRIGRETDITIVIIGHRLSTVMEADQIVVMKNGRIDSIGTHLEHIAADGWYARAFAHQSGSSAVDFRKLA